MFRLFPVHLYLNSCFFWPKALNKLQHVIIPSWRHLCRKPQQTTRGWISTCLTDILKVHSTILWIQTWLVKPDGWRWCQMFQPTNNKRSRDTYVPICCRCNRTRKTSCEKVESEDDVWLLSSLPAQQLTCIGVSEERDRHLEDYFISRDNRLMFWIWNKQTVNSSGDLLSVKSTKTPIKPLELHLQCTPLLLCPFTSSVCPDWMTRPLRGGSVYMCCWTCHKTEPTTAGGARHRRFRPSFQHPLKKRP